MPKVRIKLNSTDIEMLNNICKSISDLAKKAGIDGFILPDMSVEESKEYIQAAKNKADTIFLISPNTSKTRIQKIAKASTGFLYLVAVFGTTGVKTGIKKYNLNAIKEVKNQTKGKIPIGIGFGVSTPDDVKKYIKAGADAVIVVYHFLSESSGITNRLFFSSFSIII